MTAPRNPDFPIMPPYQPGRYYTVPTSHSQVATAGFAYFDDLLVGIPIQIHYAHKFDLIGIRVTTADDPGGLINLGIYRSLPSGLPGSLMLQTSNLDTTSTGDKTEAINQVLSPGWYFLALHPNVTGSPVLTATSVQYWIDYFGGTGINDDGSNWVSRSVTWTGTLPDPFGAVSFQAGVSDGSSLIKIPRICIRAE